MTTTTATAKPLTIPATGLRFETATTTVTATYVNGAGYKVQVRINGDHQPHLGGLYTVEDGPNGALAAYSQLVEQYAAEATEAPAEQPAKVEAIPGNVGTTMRVSDPGHTALVIAKLTGMVERGGLPGQFSISVLRGLAKNHFVKLHNDETGRYGARKYVSHATLTHAGEVRLSQLTADERAEAEKAARLAVIDSIRIAA